MVAKKVVAQVKGRGVDGSTANASECTQDVGSAREQFISYALFDTF